MTLQEQFDEIERSASDIRASAKEAYLSTPEMTEGDYVGILEDIPISMDMYQNATLWTAQYPEHLPHNIYLAIGLAGECGEILNECKKQHRNDGGILTEKRKEKIIDEASDVFFYFAAYLLSLGIKLSDVAKHNQVKLMKRMKEGKIKTR